MSAPAVDTSEYDRFGPWIDEVLSPADVPRLFRSHPLDLATARLVLPFGAPESLRLAPHPAYPRATVVTVRAGAAALEIVVPTDSSVHRLMSAATALLR